MVPDYQVAIVGAGFAGLGAAIQVRKAGRESFVVLEKGAEIGGTWRDNTYPGCACDVPSHLYSFSFALNPNWSRTFAPQPEIRAYLEDLVDAHQLRPHLRLGAEVVEARFDEQAGLWRISLAGGAKLSARSLVLGLGALSRPSVPSLKGVDGFAGTVFHSARWPAGLDLSGKRVALVGSGASAIQIVPAIAPQAAALHVFQRTPPWVIPRPDRPFGAARRERFRGARWTMRWTRLLAWLWMEARGAGFTLHPAIMWFAELLGRLHLRAQVRDPALRARLTPRYRPGCKRLLMSNDYYPALQLPQVELVSEEIAQVTARGVVTADGRERAVDVIVLATGFQVTEMLGPLRVWGRGGVALDQLWQQHPQAHLGTQVAGFPNLFMLVGPNTGLGHNSMVFMIECQVRLLLSCLAARDRAGARSIEVTAEAQAKYNRALEPRLARSVWASGCQSYYIDRSGQLSALWPGTTAEFWWRTRRLRPGDYRFA